MSSVPIAPSGLSLGGIVLADARTADVVDLGAVPGRCLLILIRHRY